MKPILRLLIFSALLANAGCAVEPTKPVSNANASANLNSNSAVASNSNTAAATNSEAAPDAVALGD